jgi:hypothetical protein
MKSSYEEVGKDFERIKIKDGEESILNRFDIDSYNIAAAYAAQQISWLREILEEIESSDIIRSPPILIIIDN